MDVHTDVHMDSDGRTGFTMSELDSSDHLQMQLELWTLGKAFGL